MTPSPASALNITTESLSFRAQTSNLDWEFSHANFSWYYIFTVTFDPRILFLTAGNYNMDESQEHVTFLAAGGTIWQLVH